MKTRLKKSELLALKIAQEAFEEFGLVLRNVKLYPAKGAWRTNVMLDVMRFEGFAEWHGDGFSQPLTVSVDSWDTMTDLLKYGFKMVQNRPCSFELHRK